MGAHLNRRVFLGAAAIAARSGVLGPAAAQQAVAPAQGPRRIAFIVSNPGVAASNAMPVGYWLPELAHPYWAFTQRGYDVTIASPNGGFVTHDRISDPDGGRFANPNDLISLRFKVARRPQEQISTTVPLTQIDPAAFDAIFVVGGLAPPTTFTDDVRLHALFSAFYESGKIAAALCHGTVVLLKARLSNGRLLAEGRRWTGYTNAEEDVVDRAMGTRFQPYRIEDEARTIPGTTFLQGPPYNPFAITDGRLITGQQGASGMLTAEHVIKALEAT